MSLKKQYSPTQKEKDFISPDKQQNNGEEEYFVEKILSNKMIKGE